QHARPDRPNGVVRGEIVESANKRDLSHRFSAIRSLPDRGQLPRKRRVGLHALVLRTGRYRVRELGNLSAKLDQTRFRAGQIENSAARTRCRSFHAATPRRKFLAKIPADERRSAPALRRPRLEGKKSRRARECLSQTARRKIAREIVRRRRRTLCEVVVAGFTGS